MQGSRELEHAGAATRIEQTPARRHAQLLHRGEGLADVPGAGEFAQAGQLLLQRFLKFVPVLIQCCLHEVRAGLSRAHDALNRRTDLINNCLTAVAKRECRIIYQLCGERRIVPNIQVNSTPREPLALRQNFILERRVATGATEAEEKPANPFVLPMLARSFELLQRPPQICLRESSVVFALDDIAAAACPMMKENIHAFLPLR